MQEPQIILKKVKVHNLKEVSLTLNHNELIVFTGVSGSGKSSLAFDTIYVEGQRRYVESLSTYARRHLEDLVKPDAELISGISPTVAIEQKTAGQNPRSTVGTMTGIYDFMRVLFARVGVAHCPVSQEVVTPQSVQHILETLRGLPAGTKVILLAPFAKNKKAEFKEEFIDLTRKGYMRVRLDGKIIDLSEPVAIDGRLAHDVDIVIDRLCIDQENDNRLAEAVTQALEVGLGLMSVMDVDSQEETLFSQHAYSPKSGLSYGPLEPSDFSFNHPSGMCSTCQGLGITQEFDLNTVIDPTLSISEDCCSIASSYKTVRYGNIYNNLASLYDFTITTPWSRLPEKGKKAFLWGIDKKWTKMRFVHPETGHSWTEFVHWKGVLNEAKERFSQAKSDLYRNKMKLLMCEEICPDCQGAKIRPYPAATTVGGKKIAQITALAIDEALCFFKELRLTEQEMFIAKELLKEITGRLQFLTGVGLHYLSLERTAPSLSGGESQRVRLASQIGSGLVGATYVLDEPSIGLHPRDNTKLIGTLKQLRDQGNTVIVVEHDEETIRSADTILDVGPLAGELGGEIVVQGNMNDLLTSKRSITGAYLSGRKQIPIPKRRKSTHVLTLKDASHHNLKNVTLEVPLQLLIAVTGVSGSGKSSLISDTLYPALANHLHKAQLSVGKNGGIAGLTQIDKVIAIDQTPIGRTPRSNPATFIKLFDEIRELFSQLPDSVSQGYKAGRFSFNVKEGSCPHCSGMGMIKIDMDFMKDEWIDCEHCRGQRFDPNTLSVLYKGKNIYEVLEMTVTEGLIFFAAIPSIHVKLQMLHKVGLDYIKLGQPSPTLSGGEAQRIKLAKELSRPQSGKTFYILDEPTTGLHFHDIDKLITILQELVNKGNTVLVIEHNMDLVKVADWIIDLGPEGGKGGGQIMATGTPEQIIKKQSPTAIALRPYLKPQTPKISERAVIPKNISAREEILIEGASENNLKSINATIPRGKITLCTGPSGSGKSSFAFDTVYAEGQRRYVESMSAYARQFVKQLPKPKVERIEGISASIAIEQKSHAGNPRSTIGTMTESYDFLRLLFAHLGVAHCPESEKPLQTISKGYVVKRLLELQDRTKVHLLSPLTLKRSEPFEMLKEKLQNLGFLRIRLNGTYYELDQEIPFDKQRKNSLFLVIDRLMISSKEEKRLFDAIDKATTLSEGTCVAALEEEDLFFNLSFTSLSTGKSYSPITPHTFSFNTESGMCLECEGLGFLYGTDLSSQEKIAEMTPLQLVRLFWKENLTKKALDLFLKFLKTAQIPPKAPIEFLSDEQKKILFNGAEDAPIVEEHNGELQWRGFNTVLASFSKSRKPRIKEALLPLFSQSSCPSCKGTRLNPLARHVKIEELSIADVCALSIDEASAFMDKIVVKDEFLKEPLEQLKHRLHFLQQIGLGYLSLDRSAPTLSGGETQRIRLARQLGSGLTGCLYVLDEPTIGLHPYNNERLNSALKHLVSLGNTLLLVEHDPLTIQLADKILDFGPHAGKEGGYITATGSLQEILNNPHSLTGAYLSGKKQIPLPSKRRQSKQFLTLKDATLHNLKNINISIPLNAITCLTGVSGSGKSTLLQDLLKPAAELALKGLRGKRGRPQVTHLGTTLEGMNHFDQLLNLTQDPMGHTNRADVSTYVDLLTPLRYFFASLPEAVARGLSAKCFSFNHRKGMCTTCTGLGFRLISMQFLPPVKVTCESCQGFRLNPLSLKVLLKGKSLGSILKMTVLEALDFLPLIPKVMRILQTLKSVGLGYLQLGQEVATLSGGEAQRIRLSKELSKRSSGHTLYLLDEPTVGLHADDIVKLVAIFQTLIEKGNTVVLIEHNLDVMACADHLIDIGPGCGHQGGYIVATGTPEEVARNKKSLTAPYLKAYLEKANRSIS